jgi:uncharacterized protein YjdB
MPEGITSIGRYAFWGCVKLESITLPSSVTYIGYQAFENCSSLTSITIPEGVSEISAYTFGGCVKLESVTLPSSITTIERYAFNETPWYATMIENGNGFLIVNGMLMDGHDAVSSSNSSELTIPEGVTAIGNRAFANCGELKSVVIPKEVGIIGAYAFVDCVNMTNVIVSEGVTSIGSYAFGAENSWGYKNLQSVTLPDSVEEIGTSAFGNCSDDFVIICPKGSVAEEYAKNNSLDYQNIEYAETETIAITPSTESLFVGDAKKLTLTITPATARQTANWTSSDEKVVTVDSKGNITAIGLGTATVKATAKDDEEKYATCEITVAKAAVTGITLSKKEINAIVGDNVTLTANVAPTNATVKDVAWSSDKETVATVDQSGKVTAVAEGTAVITATSKDNEEIKAICTITVTTEETGGDTPGSTTPETPDNENQDNSGNGDTSTGTTPETPDNENQDNSGNGDTSTGTTPETPDNENQDNSGNGDTSTGTTPGTSGGTTSDKTTGTTPGATTSDNAAGTNPGTTTSENNTQTTSTGTTGSEGQNSKTPAKANTTLQATTNKCTVKVLSADVQNPTVSYINSTDAKAKTITIPDTVTVDGVTYKVVSVADNAVQKNKKVTTITLGKNVTSIGKNAFKGCTSLKTVNIKSSSFTKIGANAFSGDKKLTTVKLTSTKLTSKSVGKNAFKGTNKKLTIKVPKKKVSSYKKYFKNKGNKTLKVKKG